MNLSQPEIQLLQWLGEEEYSQYGECHGATLNHLVRMGFARLHDDGRHQEGFIAKGASKMYAAVSLTSAGRAWLRENGGSR